MWVAAWRWGAAACLLALALSAAWGTFVTSGWLAGEVRQTVVLALAQSFGRAVALGTVDGDLARGIDLRDLVISEQGGFSRGVAVSADRVRLVVDLPTLALHPGAVLQSITRADITGARLVVERDGSGRWNLADLFAHGAGPLPEEFHGRILVHDGLILYTDAYEVAGPPFGTRVTHVAGTLEMHADRQVAVHLAGRSTDGEEATVDGRYLGTSGISDLDVTARNGAAGHWGGYLVRVNALRWLGGRFDGHVHILGTSSPTGITLDYTARLRLTDAQAEYLPTRVQLNHASGWLTLDSARASTDGLSLEANGSPLSLRGEIAYPGEPWLNLVVSSPAFDLGKVRALFFPRAQLSLTGQAAGDVWVTGPADAPSLDGDVTSARGFLDRQSFSGLRTHISYAAGVLTLTDLSAAFAGGRTAGDAVLTLSGGSSGYLFTGSAENIDVHALPSVGLAVPPGLAGRISAEVAGDAAGGRVHLMAVVRLDSGTVDGQAVDAAQALLWDDSGAFTIDRLSARADGGAVDASGRLGANGTLDLSLSARHLPLDRFGSLARLPLAGTANLEGHLTGTATAPILSGDVTAWDGRLGPVPFTFASGNLSIGPEGLSSRRLDILDGAARYQVVGGVRFHPLAAVDLRVSAEEVRVGPGARDTIPFSDVTGTLSARLALDGPLSQPAASGEVVLTEGRAWGQHLDRVAARFAGEGTRYRLVSFDAGIGGSHLYAAGKVDTGGPVDVRVWGEGIRLADLDSIFGSSGAPGGSVSLTGNVGGTLRTPDVRANLASSDLTIRGQTFEASGVAEYRDGVLSLEPLELAQGAARYRLSGEVRGGPSPTARLALDVSRGQIAAIVAASGVSLPVPLEGTVDGSAAFTGPFDDPSVRLSVTLHNGLLGGVRVGTGMVDLAMAHGAIDIRNFEMSPGQGSLTARGRIELRGTSEVEVSAQDIAPSIVAPLFRLDRPLVGLLSFTMQWSGSTRNPTAGLSLEATDVGLPDATADRVVGLAYYKDGIVHIEDGMIAKGPHKVVIQGAVPVALGQLALDPHGPLDLALRLEDADLSLLTFLTPRIQDAGGTIAGEVTVGGTVASPQMSGYIRSHGGRMRYAGLVTPVENVNADITFSQDQILVDDLSATLGGGPVVMSGTIAVSDLRPESLSLRLDAHRLAVDLPGLYTGGVDADLALTGPAAHPVLSGDVSLSQGHIAVDGPGDPAGWSGTPVALDLTATAGDGVWYDQGSVRAAVGGQVHIGGTPAQPSLSGRVRSREGTISLLGTSFTLTEGEAVFSEALGLDPQITAHAQATVTRPQSAFGETRVFLDADCVLPDSSPSCLVLSADPPMTRSEILALLAGTTAANAPGPTPDVVGQTVVGRVLLGSLRQAFQRAFSLDEFTISYDTTVQNPVTLKVGKFIVQSVYVSVAEVMGRGPQTGSTSVAPAPAPASGPLTPLNPSGQAYTVLGLQLVLSPSVSLSYDVDTLGDSGAFLLTRIPF